MTTLVPTPGAGLVDQVRRQWRRLPEGLRVALVVYLTVRLPLELVAMAAQGSLPFGPGATGMPPLEGPAWLHGWLRWDSGWYVRIIRDGFSYTPCLTEGVPCAQASIAFMPVYPMLVRGFMHLGLTLPLASFLVTHVALVLAVWGLFTLAKTLRLDSATATRATLAMLAFPTAIFLSAGYAEVLFLAMGVWALVFFERRMAVPTAVLLAVGAVTRSQGMLLAAAVAMGAFLGRKWSVAVWTCLLVALAVGGYVYWQYAAFGDPLAFLHARRAWGFNGQPALEQLSSYWYRTRTWQLGLEGWFDFFCFGWLAVCGVFSWRRFGPAYGLFLLLILVVTLQSGQAWALGRIALCGFPAFLLLGQWSRNRVVGRAMFVFGLAWVTMGALRFVHGFFTGT